MVAEAAVLRASASFDQAVRAYTLGVAKLRESPWLLNKLISREVRFRVIGYLLYLHADRDLESAVAHWSELTAIPREQFHKPYRAKADPSIRRNKHPMGCVGVAYACSHTHREIMGLVRALLSSACLSGVAQ